MSFKKEIIIFGGTHGNEWTGVYIVKNFQERIRKEFPGLKLKFILANPQAHKMNQRFRDEDLNRAFEYLNESREHSYEHLRAKELKELILADECFVIDLHTTTSNMGNTLIVSHKNSLNLNIASEVIKLVPETRVILSLDPSRKYLASQSDQGLMIEVGPVANNLLQTKALEATYELLRAILISLEQSDIIDNKEIEVYEEIEDIYYPKNSSGELLASIHEDFQDKDFIPIKESYTPFKSFEGGDLKLAVNNVYFPIFINEAAYYPSGLAFTLCTKKVLHY